MITELKKHGINCLYHFTDERNIAGIKKNGLCPRYCLDSSQIFTGGNEWSVNADDIFGQNKFVHLCLFKNHPMAYNLQQDNLRNIVWLQVDLNVLNNSSIRYCAGIANQSGAKMLTENEALDYFDFDAMKWIDFSVFGNQSRRQQVEKYEILVPFVIPTNMISGL